MLQLQAMLGKVGVVGLGPAVVACEDEEGEDGVPALVVLLGAQVQGMPRKVDRGVGDANMEAGVDADEDTPTQYA